MGWIFEGFWRFWKDCWRICLHFGLMFYFPSFSIPFLSVVVLLSLYTHSDKPINQQPTNQHPIFLQPWPGGMHVSDCEKMFFLSIFYSLSFVLLSAGPKFIKSTPLPISSPPKRKLPWRPRLDLSSTLGAILAPVFDEFWDRRIIRFCNKHPAKHLLWRPSTYPFCIQFAYKNRDFSGTVPGSLFSIFFYCSMMLKYAILGPRL